MKWKILSCLLFYSLTLLATNPGIKNIGFENGFKNWSGYTWTFTDRNGKSGVTQEVLPSDPRIVLMNDTNAYDLFTKNKLKIIPPGYKYSARLGASKTAGSLSGRQQSLEYSMLVDTTNELIVIKFAVVFQLPKTTETVHTADQMARFVISLCDEQGNAITTLCSKFDENAITLDHMQNGTTPDNYTTVWRDWKTVSANLKDFEGKQVTIRLTSMDCTPGGHFGYAYIVVDAQPLYITTKFCNGDADAILTAPDGFESYTWKSKGNVVGNSDTCKVANANEGDIYTCVLTTASGCQDSLSTTIKKIKPLALFNFSTLNCTQSTNTVQFNNLSVADLLHPNDKSARIDWEWNFGDGKSKDYSPQHTFTKSGWQNVSLNIMSYPSTCEASLDTMIEIFYPPLIGIKGDSTYCPGLTTTLKGFGADHYRWVLPDGTLSAITDSVVMKSPGGKIELRGYSSNEACNTTKSLLISEDPDWKFNINGNRFFCDGGRTTLTAEGDAISYLWTPRLSIAPTIVIDTIGQYFITATNKRGCKKSEAIQINKIALPDIKFSISPDHINTKYNTVTCTVSPESNIHYSWDMGDGNTVEGDSFDYRFKGSGSTSKYDVTLNAVNTIYGCKNNTLKTVIMAPFVPNVFSPNGDGYNDYFMPGYKATIYDRTGKIVYDGNETDNGWDGRFKGQNIDPDTYFYVLQYIDYNKQPQIIKGYVTLTR